jgi:hypothetical protein
MTAAIAGAYGRLLANAPEPWDQKLWAAHQTTIWNNFHRRRTEGPGGLDLPDSEEEKP